MLFVREKRVGMRVCLWQCVMRQPAGSPLCLPDSIVVNVFPVARRIGELARGCILKAAITRYLIAAAHGDRRVGTDRRVSTRGAIKLSSR